MSAIPLFSSAQLVSIGPCPNCGIEFAAPDNYVRCRREDKKDFYCPNGHVLSFRDSTVDKLRQELEAQKQATERARLELEAARKIRDTARHAEAIARGKLRAQAERVKNGVCPCCKRHFTNLERHMHTQHPDFATDKGG